jgi:hypothetical protein
MKRPLGAVIVSIWAASFIGSPITSGQTRHADGEWEGVLDWGSLPFGDGSTTAGVWGMHAVLLHTGKVLVVSGEGLINKCIVFDPAEPTSPHMRAFNGPSGHELHCSAHTALADGRILFQGGGGFNDRHQATIFDPNATGTCQGGSNDGLVCTISDFCPGGYCNAQPWTNLGLAGQTHGGRWYPTLTTLGDGRVLATAGVVGGPDSGNCADGYNTPEVFNPDTKRWMSLEEATYNRYQPPPAPQCTPEVIQPYPFDIRDYPLMYSLSSGKVLFAGETWQNQQPIIEKTLYPASQVWNDIVGPGSTGYLTETGVMYKPDVVLKAAYQLGENGANTILRIRMDQDPPVREFIDSLNHRRGEFYLMALPDGKVLAIGGGTDGLLTPTLTPEWIDPDDTTAQWDDLAATTDAPGRMYHSTAILLPDGRVLTAGGEDENDNARRSAQIFRPPYLFNADDSEATQPMIQDVFPVGKSSADPIRYSESFVIDLDVTAPAGTVVTLIRPGSATHSNDFEQRRVPLNDIGGFGTDMLTVTAPGNPYEAPPGYYMLFVVVNGVPSIAKFVRWHWPMKRGQRKIVSLPSTLRIMRSAIAP